MFIDECHATGFFGPTGRGSDEHTGTYGKIDIINSTLGKALGGATGGYTAGPQPLIDLLRQKARPYLFSNTLAPSVVGASLKVFEMIDQAPELIQKIKSNTALFRSEMKEAGFNLGRGEHPIVPVMLGDAKVASALADDMLKRGIYVIGESHIFSPYHSSALFFNIQSMHA